ncbi:alpha-1,6-mannosyl-glycoprotein 2-beta-N-acetylglucosaminyltransferase-like [Drosophila hydei]|uniref:Alpha-1,6-mannosyl-glycoprotein 2-beta-N-acetylglucosaminyltransferase n=1 Tax=Drosophila hydei TaxID=7224 RepID=A0A6J1LWM3_DROHY|nr:alpha-1,6-mannosyl-glycoprotein 2-beta-N-acetylglucosaminyltransferase-like [Drosophila hydei]
MAKKSKQIYCRLISMLILGYVMLQYFSLQFMDYSSDRLTDDSMYKKISKKFNMTKFFPPFYRVSTISVINRYISEVNEEQEILNERKFGPIENSSVVIVIQVHNGASYLQSLIENLSRARGISEALLIFSHDFYDDKINDYVLAIEFSKVMQIYYPHSIQTHSNKFPGTAPHDCPRNITRLKALSKRCNNALNPDLHGHYRVAEYTQEKHHWWWKANQVFHKLQVIHNFSGLVLFLEEDYIVAEDILYVLMKMQQVANKFCSDCNAFCLGNRLNSLKLLSKQDIIEYSKVQYSAWSSEQHSIALAFNRTTWSAIRSCAQDFCTYDDYKWDRSLEYVAKNCMEPKLNVLAVKKSRAFSTRNWPKLNVSKTDVELRLASKFGQLYPFKLKLSSLMMKTEQPVEQIRSGEWADPRDHRLCLSAANAVDIN